MASVLFYHLQTRRLDAALPQLLDKAYRRGWRSVVMLGSPERVEHMAEHLWTYRPDSFLPHGSAADGFPQRQPIYLTAEAETPNGADLLFLADGAWREDFGTFARICLLFDGRDPEALQAARASWRSCRSAGHHLTYWQESGQGQWHKAAEAGTPPG